MRKIFKLQSAMEYLMTYGWAILIIAVVLGALFQLGVFNSSSFSPRAPPGACQVFRPSGPGTTTNINLMGVCTGQLPQYVGNFNGQSSYLTITSNPLLKNFTFVAWVNLNAYNNADYSDVLGGSSCSSAAMAVSNSHYLILCLSCQACNGGTSTVPLKVWTFLAISFNNVSKVSKFYVNNANQSSISNWDFIAKTDQISKYLSVATRYFNGTIANVQIYNTSLSANQVQALYIKGIGGAPSPLQNLVSWWPLNGNANDYSGNNNNGVPTAVTFTSQYGK